MSYDNTEDMESGGHMKKSDLMGRFDFDGAEGIAFWIGDSDTEPITKVMFDELETLKAFIEHNLPGMFASDVVVTEEAHDEGMDAVDWDMVRDHCHDPQEAASIAVRAALEAAALFRGGAK